MQKEDLVILIVDDDQTLCKAMSEALSRAGYKTIAFTKPDEALAAVKLQPIHAAVIDVMLPKMNGRDLAKRLRQEVSSNLPVILISGIFKDKNFIREALQSTGAVTFLTKPFELETFIKQVEDKVKDQIDIPIAPLQSLLTKPDISFKERIRAINETENVHGFDLPWIYSLLLHPRINGHLNMITADGDVCGVGFQKGMIVQVNQDDAKSYFGVLLHEYGFVTQAEIDDVVKTTGSMKKLGERLVEANVLSPHAIQIVMTDQQGIRLSRTIADTSVKVNFTESDEIRQNASTDRNTLTELLNEWLISKYSLDWLKSYYMPWLSYNIRKGPEHSPTHRCLSIPVVKKVPGLLDTLLLNETLEKAISLLSSSAKESDIYPAIHALLVSRVICIGEANTKMDYDAQRIRLTKLNQSLEAQTYFERLGVSQKAKDAEIKRAYHELAKILHPDKLGPEAPTDVRDLAKKAFEKISQANTVLNDPTARATYLVELEKGRAEAVLKAEQLGEDARNKLSKGDISKARDMLEEAVSLAPPSTGMKLLLLWAKLKSPDAGQNLDLQKEARDQLAVVPPEDRHSALYYFVRGLAFKASGDANSAKKSFESVLAQNPDFIDARRELSLLANAEANKPVDLLKGDLKDVVGLLFKKKR